MRIIRTGVMNNFNFTDIEIETLKTYEDKGKIFVNSNSFVTVKSNYPSIITINPYLKFVEPDGDISNIKACRVKIVAGGNDYIKNEEKIAIEWSIKNGIPVLITFQRWRKINTMDKFVVSGAKNTLYHFESTYQRPTKTARLAERASIVNYVNMIFPQNTKQMIYFCDWNGKGCESCKNCIRLTYPEFIDEKIYSLNLSCSGDGGKCQFHCPDCFAKRCLEICKSGKPRCDIAYRNRKQKGLTEHD